MDYLSRQQQKELIECYRVHNCKRFHSMNAAVKYTGRCKFPRVDDNGMVKDITSAAIAFYSYRRLCFGWYPDADYLVVYPTVIYSPSSSTSRQCNRFLSEIVRRDGLTVRVLQSVYESLVGDESVANMYQLRVLFDDTSNSVLF
jgi:hypothetical protein